MGRKRDRKLEMLEPRRSLMERLGPPLDGAPEEMRTRSRLLVTGTLVLLVQCPVFAVYYGLLLGSTVDGLAPLLAGAAGAATLGWHRRTARTEAAGAIVVAILTATLVVVSLDFGGFWAPPVLWFPVLPLLGYALSGARAGKAYSAVAIAVLLALGAPAPDTALASAGFRLIVLVALTLVIACVSSSLDALYRRSLSAQQTILRTLSSANSQLLLLGTAVEQAAESILIVRPDGTIAYANPTFERQSGYSRHEVDNRDAAILAENRDAYDALWERAGRGEPWSGALFARRKDGTVFEEQVTVSPVLDEDGVLRNLVFVKRDISQERLLETQLRQAQKLEGIGQLAAGIAHEINTPIQYIGDNVRFLEEGFTDLMRLLETYRGLREALRAHPDLEEPALEIDTAEQDADVEFLTDEVPSAIAQSLEGVARVTKIVRAMKEFSHPGSDELEPIDLNRAIESTVTVSRNEWKYVADLETDLDPAVGTVPLLGDRFNQVILNIIVNAAHAIADAPHRGAEQRGLIRIRTRREGGDAVVEVSDTGTGIPEEILSKVFEPFFTTKEVGKGTGQGLSIAHSVIVQQHRGQLDVDSEVGRGTTFTIRVPLEPSPRERAGGSATGSRRARSAPSRDAVG